ncbi:hypothetical protein V6N13_144054 [Hibiscus sabdariffa]|uniref:Uncharacterized protein n=1 Tax=Hibiscus sabdariffa TaxID=183260 RepID=A0ABR2FJR5_9ROSI
MFNYQVSNFPLMDTGRAESDVATVIWSSALEIKKLVRAVHSAAIKAIAFFPSGLKSIGKHLRLAFAGCHVHNIYHCIQDIHHLPRMLTRGHRDGRLAFV